MSYNPTKKQREALEFLVERQRIGAIDETFPFLIGDDRVIILGINDMLPDGISIHVLEALAKANLILLKHDRFGGTVTFLQAAYDVIDGNSNLDEKEPNLDLLLAFLSKQVGPEKLRTLAVLLGVDHEISPGAAPMSYARELASSMKRRGRLWELVHKAFTIE